MINLCAFISSKHNEDIVKRCFNYREIGRLKELNIHYFDLETVKFSPVKVLFYVNMSYFPGNSIIIVNVK